MRSCFAVFVASILGAVACGARTGLPVPTSPDEDVGVDAAGDASPDVMVPVDASFDAPVDAPADVVIELACADAGIQFVYVVTEENELFSYYPVTNAFSDIGPIACPTKATPFSMGVARDGTAYSIFDDGNLFTFKTASPANTCAATPYVPTELGNTNRFGMAFSADVNDPGEKLYLASGDPSDGGPMNPEWLGTLDVSAFKLSPVGQFPVVIGEAELTGSGDGRLFGFGVDQTTTTTYHLLEFDKSTAALLSDIPIHMPTGDQTIQAWAFAYYAGSFYFFTSLQTDSISRVSLYTPTPGDTVANATEIQTLEGNLIVGAGVSTCASMQ